MLWFLLSEMYLVALLLGALGVVDAAGRINGRNVTDWFAVGDRRRLQDGAQRLASDGAVRLVRVNPTRWRPPPGAVRVDTDTWVVRGDGDDDAPGVLAWAPMRDEYKYWEDMPLTRGLVVSFDASAEAEVVRVVEATHARIARRAPGRAHVVLSAPRARDTLHRLAALPGVRWLDRAPNATHWTAASLASQGVLEDSVSCCPNETLSLADTGLDRDHCVFMDPTQKPVADVLLGDVSYVLAEDTRHAKIRAYVRVCGAPGCAVVTDTLDASGHGTHVSGILAGGAACQGASGAPLSRLVFFDLEAQAGTGQLMLPFDMASMWRTAQMNGARLFSASWGGWCDGVYDDFAAQFDAWAWANPEFVFVVAAGNCGDSPQTNLASPASAKNVISVGASFLGPEAYADGSRGYTNPPAERVAASSVASFSSFGPLDDGRIGPLVTAPGVLVRSARAGGPPGHFGTTLMSGTSMAAPNVPVALLLRQLNQQKHLERPWSATVRAVLVAHAEPATIAVDADTLAVLPGGGARRAGFGITHHHSLDTTAVLQLTASEPFSLAAERCFQPLESDVRVVLAWTDPPGSPLASLALVNTLNLLMMTATTDPLVFDARDEVNNHRRFDLVLAGLPLLRVFVRAAHLSTAQPFALVVTNASEVPCPFLLASETCAVAHGQGLLLQGECRARSCDPGYVLDAAGCVPGSSSSGGVRSCEAEGAVFNGTGCACQGFLGHLASGCLARCVGGQAVCFEATEPPPVRALSTETQNTWTSVWLGVVFAAMAFALLFGAAVADDDMNVDAEGRVLRAAWTQYHCVYLLLLAIVLASAVVFLVLVPDSSPVVLLGVVVLATSMVICCMPHTPTILCLYLFIVVVLAATVLSTSVPVVVTALVVSFVALLLVGMLEDRVMVLYFASAAFLFAVFVVALVEYDMDAHGVGVFVILIVACVLAGFGMLLSVYFMAPACPPMLYRPFRAAKPTGKVPSRTPPAVQGLDMRALLESGGLRNRR